MPDKPWIYLLRHGEIDLSGRKIFIGQTDLPLSEKGKEQAVWWQEQWASTSFARIYCSDLTRSRGFAEIIAGEKQDLIETKTQLREIALGGWEGLSKDEVNRRFPGEWHKRGSCIDEYRPDRGESFSDVGARVWPLFEQIMALPERPVLIVGHAGVNRVILCRLLGMPLRNLFRLAQDYAALNIIESTGADLRLRAMNVCPTSF
jgi:alpha-ribazole phosphatase